MFIESAQLESGHRIEADVCIVGGGAAGITLANRLAKGRTTRSMGTTRMHRDPKQGVVDATCRVDGIDNLYIAGSVFVRDAPPQGIGLHVALRALSITPVEFRPVAFVNAAVTSFIVFMLARPARIGFSGGRTRG
jgi:hypothetical protein